MAPNIDAVSPIAGLSCGKYVPSSALAIRSIMNATWLGHAIGSPHGDASEYHGSAVFTPPVRRAADCASDDTVRVISPSERPGITPFRRRSADGSHRRRSRVRSSDCGSNPIDALPWATTNPGSPIRCACTLTRWSPSRGRCTTDSTCSPDTMMFSKYSEMDPRSNHGCPKASSNGGTKQSRWTTPATADPRKPRRSAASAS
uniref:Unannotated protein n=1 Tax=freshwater metagenome TaxID=449393 RepID=A0A6J7MB73_9ZZZZ